MAELVDALASGASDRKVMRVRVSLAAPCRREAAHSGRFCIST